MIKHIHLKIDSSLLDKFEKKIERINQDDLASKSTKSNVIRNLIVEYLKRK
jgi:hypothetical protein